MEQYGLVYENNGETANVSLQRHLTCEKCGRCGMLSGSNRREMIIEALNPIQAGEGQRVLLETDDRRVLFISFMLYLVPLAGLISGIFLWLVLADYLGLTVNRELTAAGAGFFLMAIIYYFIRIWDNRIKNNPYYKPVLTELIEKGVECNDPLGQINNEDNDG